MCCCIGIRPVTGKFPFSPFLLQIPPWNRCKYVLPVFGRNKRVETVKLLGAILASNFTWSEHIAYIQRVITQNFYLLNMSLNTSSMNDVFNALVLSRIQYVLPVYYGHLLQVDKKPHRYLTTLSQFKNLLNKFDFSPFCVGER